MTIRISYRFSSEMLEVYSRQKEQLREVTEMHPANPDVHQTQEQSAYSHDKPKLEQMTQLLDHVNLQLQIARRELQQRKRDVGNCKGKIRHMVESGQITLEEIRYIPAMFELYNEMVLDS